MALPADPAQLADAAAGGDRRALARIISVVENDREEAGPILAHLYPRGGRAQVVGITGAPGSGKSTLADRLIGRLRDEGRWVGVVAVDPSSPFTGGALLGDRVRMQEHATDAGVFVRSMSSRGHLGGLAEATGKVVAVLDGCGFDPVLVETVGVGQSEVEVVETADTVVVMVTPGWGDGVQAAKAGLLEIGDVFCVNKVDLPGAEEVVRELTQLLELAPEDGWRPPIVRCAAATGEGVEEVWQAVTRHAGFLHATGAVFERRQRRAMEAMRRAMAARLSRRVALDGLDEELIRRLERREVDPWTAADLALGSA